MENFIDYLVINNVLVCEYKPGRRLREAEIKLKPRRWLSAVLAGEIIRKKLAH
jgi:hypothetical protein